MEFQEAGISVAPWLPPLVAFVISFFSSMGGVSGAFLLLPFQVSVLGYTAPSVSATNQLFNIVAIPGGVYRFAREQRMLWPLAWLVVVGTVPGVFIGAIVRVRYLPEPGDFKLFAAVVLLFIGSRMLRDLLGPTTPADNRSAQAFAGQLRQRDSTGSPPPGGAPSTKVVAVTVRHLAYEFCGEQHRVSTWGLLLLCFAVGIVGGIYGIGGGSIVAPFLVGVLRLPVHSVAGATLMGTLATSVAGVAFYQGISPWFPDLSVAPDWKLGALFGVGGLAGIYLGARCQKFIPARVIKWMLAGIVLLTAARYVWEY